MKMIKKIQAAAPAGESRCTVSQSVGAPRRRGWGRSSGLFRLHMKGTLMGKLFTISRNWLASLRRTSLQGLQVPKIAKHQKYRIRNYD